MWLEVLREIPNDSQPSMITTPKGTDEHQQMPTNIAKETWALHVDGASNKDGSGAGIVLVIPHGYKSTYDLRFTFNARTMRWSMKPY